MIQVCDRENGIWHTELLSRFNSEKVEVKNEVVLYVDDHKQPRVSSAPDELNLGPYECVGADSPLPQGNLQGSMYFSMMLLSEI